MRISNKLEVLFKVLENNSFSKAAEQLGYSQSAVSHIISSLEDEFRFPLLVRNRGRIQLTEEAKELLPYMQAVCETNNNLDQKHKELLAKGTSQIRIGTVSYDLAPRILDIIQDFSLSQRGCSVKVQCGSNREIETALKTEKIDVGFYYTPNFNLGYKKALFADEMVAVFHPTSPLAELEQVPTRRLKDFPFILFSGDLEPQVATVLNIYNILDHASFHVKDNLSILSMVRSNMGVSIVPQVVLEHIGLDNIAYRRLYPPIFRTLYMVAKPPKELSEEVNAFISFVASVF